MLHTHAAICCVKCAGGVWWSNCVRLKSDILFECYFSERELKIDEIWHLHKPTEKKVISKTNFPGVQLSLTSSQPVITSQWNYSLIGKKKTKQKKPQQNKIFTVTQYTASSKTSMKWWELKDDDDEKCWQGPELHSLPWLCPQPNVAAFLRFPGNRLNLHYETKLDSFNTSSPNPHLLPIKF